MVKRIIEQLIITAGQWQKFGGEQYELQFESMFNQLQQITEKDRKETEDMILENIRKAEAMTA